MATQTTPNSPAAWRPDLTVYTPTDVVPDAILLSTATIVGSIEGDEPAVRVPFVADDGVASIVAEGAVIPDANQAFDEVVVSTHKVSALGKYSYEALMQPEAARLITESLQRAIVRKANTVYLVNPVAANAPTGLLHTPDITDAGAITVNLDPLVDAIAGIEDANGIATNIVCSPKTWATVSKLKVTSASEQPLVTPDVTQPGTRQLLGLPVSVAPDMTDGDLLVVDRTTVIAASGQVRLARSEDAFFSSDVVAIRLTWRFGWGVQRAERIAKLTATP